MPVAAAFFAIVLIWATTPLAVKWSSVGVSFYDAVTLRMLLAAPSALVLLRLLRVALPWANGAWRSYAAGAFGIYAGLIPVYFAAQTVPSGLISVLFGLAPILSSLLAVRWLGEAAPSPTRLLALCTALGGLALVFNGELSAGSRLSAGLLAVLGAVLAFTVSGLLVKRRAQQLHPLAQTTGTLLLALPCYLLTWLLKDGSLPQALGLRALLATGYLALAGSLLSFVLYFHILQRLPLSRVALTTLVSPVLALLLGIALAGEQVPATALAGSGLILLALAACQWEDWLWQRLSRRRGQRVH